METLLLIGVMIIIITVACILYFGIDFLAKKDLFFTIVQEGQIRVVKKSGRGNKYLANINGKSINIHTGEITDNPQNLMGILNNLFGVYWIGLPPYHHMHTYNFRWNKWSMEQGEKKTQYVLIKKEETISWLYYRAQYAMMMENVETIERIPLKLVFTITVFVKNAEKALFKTNDWLSNITSAVTGAVKDFVGNCKLTDLISMKTEISGNKVVGIAFRKKDNSHFVDVIKSLNDAGDGNIGLIESFGIQIDVVNFLSLDVTDDAQNKLLAATQAKYVAEENAKAAIKTAEGEAKAIELKGAAIAGALKAKVDALGVHGGSIGIVELSAAIAEASPSSLILGASVMPTTEVNQKKGSVI